MDASTRPVEPPRSQRRRLVHAWRRTELNGPPLCGTDVPYRGVPLVPPFEVCVVCADLAKGERRETVR